MHTNGERKFRRWKQLQTNNCGRMKPDSEIAFKKHKKIKAHLVCDDLTVSDGAPAPANGLLSVLSRSHSKVTDTSAKSNRKFRAKELREKRTASKAWDEHAPGSSWTTLSWLDCPECTKMFWFFRCMATSDTWRQTVKQKQALR
jgi:hypothetical protein